MVLALFFAIFFMGVSSLGAWELSWETVRAKLQQPVPDWMQQQIQEDFQPFYEKGVTTAEIDATIKEVSRIPSGHLASFVRYRIKDNKVSFVSPCSPTDVRIIHVVEVLEDMAKNLGLPDLDFLVSLWDSYDNPLFLEKTYCPVFTMCKLTGNNRGVLYPEFRFFSYRQRITNDINWINERSLWEQKKEKAFWRGMTSGGYYTSDTWDMMPRSRLAILSQERPDLVDAAFTSPYSLHNHIKARIEKCDLFQPWVYPMDSVSYKYLVAVDGNTFASNFWWLLLSNCLVIKSDSDYSEWFYKGIDPYVHYIPYALDLSDFEEKIAWAKSHDAAAKRIAEQGTLFAREHLSNEALVVYFYRLLLAYAVLQRE